MRAGVSLIFLIAFSPACCFASAPSSAEWVVARSSHFEVYSQAGPDRAIAALTRFEELRSFFDKNRVIQTGTPIGNRPPVRVIGFNSRKEYDTVKLRPNADAYYTGTADRDYIVMPMLATNDFAVAAHEYAHSVLHSNGLKLPDWLNEGLAELFSTIRITDRRCELGGPIPVHIETLRLHPWLSASQLLAVESASRLRETRSGAAIFYAESWALTDMLTSSPEYAPRFGELIGMFNSPELSSPQALAKTFNKSPDAIVSDLQDWVAHNRMTRRTLSPLPPETFGTKVEPVPVPEARALIADLLFANGEWDRSQEIYLSLLQRNSGDPDVLASLGNLALRMGDHAAALRYWSKAIDSGLKNAALCYRYALLAEESQLPPKEVERALESAVAINPHFDDARYRLALLKSNAGEHAAAVSQLQSMAAPAKTRAFGYWTALAYSLSELGRREESQNAAAQAMQFAASPEQRARAAELAYIARTDLAVRFSHDAQGKPQLVTIRVPHGGMESNPFVEADDQLQVETGKLREVQCKEGKLTGFLVQSEARTLTLSVPDPLHVLIRNGPTQFYCGPQTPINVRVEYAAEANSGAGLLRGMDFGEQSTGPPSQDAAQ